MKKIGILGSFGSGNLGDEAAWISIRDFLESKDPRYLYETIIFQWSIPYSHTNHHTRAFGFLSDIEIQYINHNFKCIIISGGGIVGGHWGLTCTGRLDYLLDKLTIPIYCISISAEDDEYTDKQKLLINKLFNISKIFTVRDVHSFNAIKKIIEKYPEVTPDVVTCLKEKYININSPDILITTATQCLTDAHILWMKKLFNLLPKERLKYIPFTSDQNDIVACQQYTQKLGFELYHPSVMQFLTRKSNFVIAGRLHAAVFAANTGTPFFAINYHPKVKSFCDSIGYNHYWPKEDIYKKDITNYGFDFEQFDFNELAKEIKTSISNPEKPVVKYTAIKILEKMFEYDINGK